VKPDDQTVVSGGGAYFAVVPFGAGPFQYQWNHDGQALAGSTNAALVLVDVQQDDAGVYEVALNDGVSQTSASATLTVLEGLLIVNQPVGLDLQAGQNAELTVSAQGVDPLSYQWQHNGVDIVGASGAVLALQNVRVDQAGSYTVVVSNPFATLLSQPAAVNVVPVESRIVSFQRLADRTIELVLTGPIGARAVVEVSNDLFEWTELVNLPIVSTSFSTIDSAAPNFDARFYRVRVVP